MGRYSHAPAYPDPRSSPGAPRPCEIRKAAHGGHGDNGGFDERALPKYDLYDVCFSYNFTNWLPFYWAGYDQTTCYTYVLEDLTDLDEVFAGFAHSKRKNIKKAESQVTVKEDLSPQDFFANHEMTLAKQGQRINYSYDLFERVYQATHQRNAGKTWYAVDENGNLHAAILVVFDVKSAYYLVSTMDPDYRNSGAGTLLIRHAIAWVSKHTRKFDFEGSMIPGVEHSFRKFGARQKPYFRISRNLLPWPVRAYLNRRRLRRQGPEPEAWQRRAGVSRGAISCG